MNLRNPLIKNNKTWLHGDAQNRTVHYNKILNVKSYVSSQFNRSKSTPVKNIYSNVDCKMVHQNQRKRMLENKRMIYSLVDIDKNYQSYGKNQTKQNKKLANTLRNQYNEYQKLLKISNENLSLFKKLRNSCSEIGSSDGWRKREKNHQKVLKLRQNPIQFFVQVDEQFYTTFSQLRKRKKQKKVAIQQILIRKRENDLRKFQKYKQQKSKSNEKQKEKSKQKLQPSLRKQYDSLEIDNPLQSVGLLQKQSQEDHLQSTNFKSNNFKKKLLKNKGRKKIFSKIRYQKNNEQDYIQLQN